MTSRKDRNSMAGRAKRYAKVGTAIGGMAGRAAVGRVLGRQPDRNARADELRRLLGGLKGPLMKVAQIMATVPDLLPEDYAAELRQLQSAAPSMGWPFVARRMSGELGPQWRTRFGEFEHTAAAAASLGQVHRATHPDGRGLACKLQYPDMASTVEADLKQLRLGLALYHRFDPAIDPRNILTELGERLREEVDYRREAKHMALYGAMLAGEPGVCVPEPVPELSTGRLLSMTWLEGRSLLEMTGAADARRQRVARHLFRAWYAPLYSHGAIHGDPHPGNYQVAADDRLNLLDFGCIRLFPAPFVQGVIDLYHALRDGDEALAVHAYETWGFNGLDRDMIATLNRWADFLYGPLLQDRVVAMAETSSTAKAAAVVADVHRRLRQRGGITPPREFVLMDRAAIGLGSVFTRLDARANWHRLFHELIDGFDAAAMARRQAGLLAEVGLEMPLEIPLEIPRPGV